MNGSISMFPAHRLLLVVLLGFSSGLPLALVSSTLQAWFATAGLSVMATGMLSLVHLPYLFRVFLAPLLDRYALCRLGRRRSWIFMMQIVMLLGFNVLAFCTPVSEPLMMGALAWLLAFCSASQDTAIDAHRAEYLSAPYYGLGMSLAIAAYRVALLLSGGVALLLASRYGWRLTYQCMSLFFLLPMAGILWSREPVVPPTLAASWFTEPFKALFNRQGVMWLLGFAFFFKLGEAFTTSTSGIVMPFLIQGMGFSMTTIALVNKVFGVFSVVLGGILAGFLLLRLTLFQALLSFGIAQALTNVFFVILAMVGKSVPLLAVAVVLDNCAAGMGTTALLALFMAVADKHYTATQLSLLIAVSTIPRVLSGPFAALLQGAVGWVGLYLFSVIAAVLFIPFLFKLRRTVLFKMVISSNF